MGIVINLEERRKKKEEKRANPVVSVMKDSLDNDAVMRRYGITAKPPQAPQPTIQERTANIQESISRINSLMAQLEEINRPKKDTK